MSCRGGGRSVALLAQRAGGFRGLRCGLYDPLLRHRRRPLARIPPQEQRGRVRGGVEVTRGTEDEVEGGGVGLDGPKRIK